MPTCDPLGGRPPVVSAGFPSPAEDHAEDPLDLEDLLHASRSNVALFPVRDERLASMGVAAGDVLVLERGADPAPGSIAIGTVDGELAPVLVPSEGEPPADGPDSLGVAAWNLHRLRDGPPPDVPEPGVMDVVGGARPATFLMRVRGDCMAGGGVYDGDVIVVDRSLPPRPGDALVAAVAGELSLKRLTWTPAGLRLATQGRGEGPRPLDVPFTPWGVATWSIRRLRAPLP